MSDLPKSIATGEMNIPGLGIFKVHVLDDGRRIIETNETIEQMISELKNIPTQPINDSKGD